MSAFGVFFDTFFDGETGKAIAEFGGKDAQIVAMYLVKNRDDNMIGLYPINWNIARERIGTLSIRQVERAVVAIGEAKFADYDVATGYVWVRELARFRLRLDGKPLEEKDKRLIGAQALYTKARSNPFLQPFYERYRRELRLKRPAAFKGEWRQLGRGREGASEVLGSQRSEIRDQGSEAERAYQGDQDQRTDVRDAHAVLVKLCHAVLDDIDAGTVPADETKDEVKARAAKAGIAYDATAITKALDSAETQRHAKAGHR